MEMEITIRPVATLDEYRACEDLQRRVWAMPDDLDVVPLHLLLTAQKNGGLLLGAFAGAEMIGFVFGFPGLTPEGKVKHCSHMMGIAPGHQSKGLGYRLKLAQRAFVLEQGLDLITWTYDPLESRNAYLNIHKLGAVCRTYRRDLYGPMSDGLNAGLPSDRFQVEWWIAEGHVERRLAGEAAPWPEETVPALTAHRTAAGLPAPDVRTLDASSPAVQVEIPAEYQAIKAADPALAMEWRLTTRQVFEHYFAAGYRVVDFASRVAAGERRSFYLLQAHRSPTHRRG